MTKNGFRSKPQPNKNDLLQQLTTEVENTSMAVRVSQMLIKQLLTNGQSMQSDLNQMVSQITELQYKFLAVQKALNLDSSKLEELANEERLKDFEEAASKADIQDQLEVAETADADSVVTITSTTIGPQDKGIFRSRIKLSETGVPELINELTGKRIGDKVTVKLNDIEHNIELLDIKKSKVSTTSVDTAVN